MDGLMIQLPVEVTDHTLPMLWEHPIMSEGSLMLLDMSNSNGVPTGDVNTPGTMIPNIAWETAKAILGSGDRTSLSPVVAKTLTAPQGYAEQSTKKGLHVLISQTVHTVANSYNLYTPASIIAYMAANPTHNYFISIWEKKTRIAIAGSKATIALLLQNTANYLAYALNIGSSESGFSPVGVANRRITTQINNTNPFIKNIRTEGITGTFGASTHLDPAGNALFAVGGGVNAFGNTPNNTWPSTIRYQTYIEDLSVSNRSYAAVDAIDIALFNEAFASGGRFFGDTFTNPTTLA